jgi:hypothetical protein
MVIAIEQRGMTRETNEGDPWRDHNHCTSERRLGFKGVTNGRGRILEKGESVRDQGEVPTGLVRLICGDSPALLLVGE